MTPAIIISSCALVFTVGSFWWLYVRPGRLMMSEIKTFAANIHRDYAVLRLPLALYNTGAKPLIVVDLKATLTSQDTSAVAASRYFRKTIHPKAEDTEDFPHPYVIAGRTVVTKFVDFTVDPSVMVTGNPSEVDVEVMISRRGWRSVGKITVRTDIIGNPESAIAYSNDPAHWPAGQYGKAAKALAAIREDLGR